jgi:hypothetical protein
MKTIIKYLVVLSGILILFSACEFDNYDEPKVEFSGHLKFNGENLDTKQGTVFQLFQYEEDGYLAAKKGPILVNIDQEGKFSALLFSGRYKMTVYDNGGMTNTYDWIDFPKNASGGLDTVYFTLTGNKTMDFEVAPYYKINDFQAVYRNDSIISTFSLQKVTNITDAAIIGFRRVAMYVSPTMHVNNDTQMEIIRSGSTPTDTPVEIKASLKDYYSNTYYVNNYRNYVYVRIGISLRVSAQDYIFSKIIKVEGIPQETINKFK